MSEGRRFCENCGTAIGETTNFCPNCGKAQKPDPEVPSGPPPPIPETGKISTPTVPGVPSPPPAQSGGGLWGSPRRSLITLAVIVVVIIILGRGCLGGSGSSSSGPGVGKTFTKENYAELDTDPNSFRGASVDVVGRILRNPEVRGNNTDFQMFADPENSEWNTIVHAKSAPSGLKSGDFVRVKGKVRGQREGENAFGATITSTEVDADSVETAENPAPKGPKTRT